MSLGINHEGFLAYASQRMIRYSRSEKFMRWVCRYLLLHLKPVQVSIALYDIGTKTLSIEVSQGKHKIPRKLISLQDDNPLVQWFIQQHGGLPRTKRSHRCITAGKLRQESSPASEAMLRELLLHHAEVCIRIETRERLAGYLLIGSRIDHTPYTEEDLVFLRILANNIGTEIEKEEYYTHSFSDPLTGLLNRTTMLDSLQNLMDKASRGEPGIDFAVAMIDIDDFKFINDHFGHLTGDQAIKAAAGLIRSGIRESDLAFRYGGEEFLLLLKKTTRDPNKLISKSEFEFDISVVLERLRDKCVSRPLSCAGKLVPFSISTGVTFMRSSDQKPEALILQADQALYQAKKSGKNRVVVYREGI